MKKWRLFLTLSAEETWINGIQMQGYRLIHVSPIKHCYTFAALPTDTAFNPMTRLDVRDRPLSKQDYQDYQQLFMDSGWTLIRGSRFGGIQYFQQNREMVGDDIFSDDQSKAANWSRDQQLGVSYGTLCLVWFVSVGLESKWTSAVNIFNFKSWYLRPGLWQMPSSQFWPAFWFETPFALIRGLVPFVVLIISGYYFARAFSTRRS